MKDIIRNAALLATLTLAACAPQPDPPLIIKGKLIVPVGQTLVIPTSGILLSNGVVIGGAQ